MDIQIIPDDETTMLLGTGYDSLTGCDKDRIIKNDKVSTLSGGSGSNVNLYINEIKTREELNKILGIQGSAQLNIGKFEGSTRVEFARNYNFTNQAYYLFVHVIVKKQSEVLSEYVLRDEVRALISQKELFYKIGGDHFIASRNTGGEFIAILKLETSNTNQLTELKTSFKGNYFNAFRGELSSSNKVQEIIEKYNGTYEVFCRGIKGNLPNFWEPKEVIQFATNFSSEINNPNNGIVFSLLAKPYSDLIEFINIDLYDLTKPDDIINSLTVVYNKALDIHNNILYVISNPSQFINPDIDSLLGVDSQLTLILDKIRDHAKICIQYPNDPDKCRFLEAKELELPEFILPKRIKGEYKLMRSPACGIEGYEKKKILKECRTPANGIEILETREVVQRLMSNENLAEGKLLVKNLGFDDNWVVGKVEVINRERAPGSGVSLDILTYKITLQKFQYKLAPHVDCGYNLVDDFEKPIYKECRHPSHGFEE